jgi:hypothetical protein
MFPMITRMGEPLHSIEEPVEFVCELGLLDIDYEAPLSILHMIWDFGMQNTVIEVEFSGDISFQAQVDGTRYCIRARMGFGSEQRKHSSTAIGLTR